MAQHHPVDVKRAQVAGQHLFAANDPKHTPGPWHRNIKPASRYPVVFAGRNTHVARLVTDGLADDEAEANADLIAAAPDLLSELEKAHQIIRNALNLMTTEQKLRWAEMNERDDCIGEGTTRANERMTVIAKATGSAA